MTLTSSLFLGSSSIQTNQLALQVVGNNISNATTPGFVREDVSLSPVAGNRFGTFSVGNGASVQSVTQKIDQFLAERARAAGGDFQAADARATVGKRVETAFNALSSGDLSSQWNDFISSLQQVQTQPTNLNIRSIAVEKASSFADSVRSVRTQLDNIRSDVSKEVKLSVDPINQSLSRIDELNTKIVALEAGGSKDSAGSIRTVRDQELSKLSDQIDIRVSELPSGAVNVYSGNDFLLFDGVINKVGTKTTIDRGLSTDSLVFASSQATVPTEGGKLGGIQAARDVDVNNVIDSLDSIAQYIISKVNEVQSSGQGLNNLTNVKGTYATLIPTGAGLPLSSSQTGLVYPPRNGSFELRIGNKLTGQTSTSVITVNPQTDSLNSIVGKINATSLGGGAASVDSQGFLNIKAPAGYEFSFGNDTSGFLSAVGVNTLFTGDSSGTISINDFVKGTPANLAAARNGSTGDSSNVNKFLDLNNLQVGGLSIPGRFTSLVQQIGTSSQAASVSADAKQTSRDALVAQSSSITGVSLDEETVKLLAYQQSFQASARFVSTINSLLEQVINLGR